MSISSRLTEVLRDAAELPFDDSSRIIIFSDLHRGDNSRADDFAPNEALFIHALNYYLREGFSYIELGDGDELTENGNFDDILRAHKEVFLVMREFHKLGRLHLIFGNHDIIRKLPNEVRRTLDKFVDSLTNKQEQLFEGIAIHEGMCLRYPTGDSLFLVHGHQGDLLNDKLWWLGKFFVSTFWRYLQLLGMKDPTSAAQNTRKGDKVEAEIEQWVIANQQPLVMGHTHRPYFPEPGTPPFFNDGSGVVPNEITGIEIDSGDIMLIKWVVAHDAQGTMQARREVLAGPRRVREIFLDVTGVEHLQPEGEPIDE
jgi:UDP-2,3-diacylglucosamine pyrophosphatase LpxH